MDSPIFVLILHGGPFDGKGLEIDNVVAPLEIGFPEDLHPRIKALADAEHPGRQGVYSARYVSRPCVRHLGGEIHYDYSGLAPRRS